MAKSMKYEMQTGVGGTGVQETIIGCHTTVCYIMVTHVKMFGNNPVSTTWHGAETTAGAFVKVEVV